MFEDDFDELNNFENYLEKDKSRAKRRHKDVSKALRKASISKLVYQFNWYDNLHQYSKNKVHCSCPMCSFNNKRKQKLGFNRAVTMQDLRRTLDMDQQLKEIA